MKDLSNTRASLLEVGEDGVGQRVDNFLLRRLKGVPKSHVYRVVRSGEVRVNSARVKPDRKLKLGDRVRLPPIRLGPPATTAPARPLGLPILYEDEALIAVDKPSGLAVHGGSGISAAVIESLRVERPEARFLELVHRLDRDTSGILLVAKKRAALLALHRQLREGEMEKTYLAIVKGRWDGGARDIKAPLQKSLAASGERRVRVAPDGQASRTRVVPVARTDSASLLRLGLLTGRTHQIRVHLAHVGHPVLGDDKYGDFALNRSLKAKGVTRLCLHAQRLRFSHPFSGEPLELRSPLSAALAALVRDWFGSDVDA